ncbi:DUF1214 domain-containing protein [Mycolicibacterium sp. P1-5]|uniref:DUF1214 domain-containing protein n=1 Tax=Mycolicibacterium sp. P1-5 TaxID=2024617 RepID=UPI0011EE11E4|nr:DUF1214 domain-containing protein [Mycolicibacterium sp. P1-5]KAA0105076.1 DUF1254 domain-containing protein [Mycolicibacterium sp. P1-5]
MNSIDVNPDNFIRAESDMYFGHAVAEGGFGTFHHDRELSPPEVRRVVRQNRDTLYSVAVFDLDAGPTTITVPDGGDRFISTQIITEDHYVPGVYYGAGRHTLTREDIGTRYVLAAIRILINPSDPADFGAVHAIQDAIKVDQIDSGHFETPDWDAASQNTVRDALLQLATTLPDTRRMFGTPAATDPVRRLIGAASAWGGNPETEALYLNVVPADNDGSATYELTIADVPVDGFWSVTVYDSDGYFTPNPENAYSVNNITADRSADGSVDIHFGGDPHSSNYLPITPGWNYLVRLYRPRDIILSGQWTFPQPRRAN